MLLFCAEVIGISGVQKQPSRRRPGRSPVQNLSSKLDWTRMLGFDQISDMRGKLNTDVTRVGSKVGGKIGTKLGIKVGVKIGIKTGLKA
jgi:hypothetical protein